MKSFKILDRNSEKIFRKRILMKSPINPHFLPEKEKEREV